MLRSACRSIGIRACSLVTPNLIFHVQFYFILSSYLDIICRSIINAIFFGGSSSLLVIFSNLKAQAIMLRRLIFQDQKEFFFSSANVLTGQSGVSTLPVATTTLVSQVFPLSQSQHPHSITTPSLGIRLQQTWPLSSSVQQFHASTRRREEESGDAFDFNREELGYRKAHTFLCQ